MQVVNELNPENIRSGEYRSDWTGNIRTGNVNVELYNRNPPQWGELTKQQQEAISRVVEKATGKLSGKKRNELLQMFSEPDLPEYIYNDYTHGQKGFAPWSALFGDTSGLASRFESLFKTPDAGTPGNALQDTNRNGIIFDDVLDQQENYQQEIESDIASEESTNDSKEDDYRSNSKLQEVLYRAENYFLSDNTYDNHIIERHGSNSAYINKSHFYAGFDIKAAIDSTLKGNNFLLLPNTRGRTGYIFEQTFVNPIGVSSKGKLLYTIKVVIDEFGNVITAFPK